MPPCDIAPLPLSIWAIRLQKATDLDHKMVYLLLGYLQVPQLLYNILPCNHHSLDFLGQESHLAWVYTLDSSHLGEASFSHFGEGQRTSCSGQKPHP
uniref:Uncharacterized protein n=1 Tax=Arundo donax TaxID=35708 RepID=A0A0A9DNB2_ARUDO